MTFIPDGYTTCGQVDGYSFLYRPLLSHQRAALRRELRGLPELLFRLSVSAVIRGRLIVRDWEDIDNLPDETLWHMFLTVTGTGQDQQEQQDAQNLYRGARLALEYPHLMQVSCEQCQHWWYNPLTGVTAERDGQPLRRQPGGTLLCQTALGCPKGTPQKPVAFSPKNSFAFQHWQLAGGEGCPDDDIVRRNWTILRKAEHDIRDERARRLRTHSPTHGRTMAGG